MLALGNEEGKPGNNSLKKEEVISVLSILGRIRSSEDAVDANMSKVQSHMKKDQTTSILNGLFFNVIYH